MREHKYRAFNKEIEGGHMVFSDGRDKVDRQVEYDFLIDEKGNLVCAWFEDYDDSFGFSRTNNGTLDNLMQFTGLLDKNGVEIYEGDLCADKDSIVQIVWYENHQWGCKIVKTEYILKKDLTFPLWQWDRCEKNGNRELEVIGNIHENPGLLEQQPCG